MKPFHALVFAALPLLSAAALAQHAQVSAVAVQPTNPGRVWVCNKDNATVSCVDIASSSVVAEIPVGIHPRSLAFSLDGARLFVANQRGNVPITRNFVTPFTGTEQRGTVSVIDIGTLSLTNTLTNVGTEPYGVAVAPNGSTSSSAASARRRSSSTTCRRWRRWSRCSIRAT
jgi:YVTN family beta-propeller protein